MTTAQPFLFDLDGTLADTLPDIAASGNHVRQLHGLPPAALGEVRRWIGDGLPALLRRALETVLPTDASAAAGLLEQASRDYHQHHVEHLAVGTRLYPGVRATLERLAAQGHPMAVVTNKPIAFASPLVQRLGLADLLPVVVGGDSASRRKPDPAPLRLALQRLGCAATGEPPQGLVMVGDGLQDLQAGRQLGACTIACLYGYGDPVALRAAAADRYWTAFGVD